MKPFSASTTAPHARAQANADFFGIPYVCFFDTSGNYRVERFDEKLACHQAGTVFQPKRPK